MPAWPALVVRSLLGACLAANAAYSVMAIWAARKWRQTEKPPQTDWTPGVTLLKPVRGVDAEAWENFASFCRQDYPIDRVQILFGAIDPADRALDMARRLQTEFPDHNIGIVTLTPSDPIGNNRKVSNLTAMLPHAEHDLIALCDSDMRARPDYLRRVVAPFAPPAPDDPARRGRPVGLVTCPYRGARPRSLAAVLEAVSIGADFIPSALVSRALEGVSFAFGSTIVLPRSVLAEIGGFGPLLDELADDYRLGNGVFRAGYEVVLSDYVIDSVLGREQFGAMWSRRLRWNRTMRSCRPAGYGGAFITHGFALALLFAASMGFSAVGWLALAGVLLLRFVTVAVIAGSWTGDGAVLRFLPLLPLSDLLSAALYVCSFLGNRITWRGDRFRLLPGGRLVREE